MYQIKIDNAPHEIDESSIKKVVTESLKSLDLTGQYEIEIIFTDRENIALLNRKFRKINHPTDVLSFPQDHFYEKKKSILGSIVICLEIVLEKREGIEDVVKHGLMHLLGYDHETDEPKWNAAAKKIDCNL